MLAIAIFIQIGSYFFARETEYITFGAVHCVFWVSCFMLPFLLAPKSGLWFGVCVHILWVTKMFRPKWERWIFGVPNGILIFLEFVFEMCFEVAIEI